MIFFDTKGMRFSVLFFSFLYYTDEERIDSVHCQGRRGVRGGDLNDFFCA